MSNGRRRLKAVRRAPPPARLIDPGDGGTGDAPTLSVDGKHDAAPITLMRLGERDLEAGIRAIDEGAKPTAVVTGLGERPEITTQARRLTRAAGTPWLCDSLLHRTALPGYRTATYLQDLDYAPGRDQDPYTAAEFEDPDMVRRIARAGIGIEIDKGASAGYAGLFVASGLQDPWLRADGALLRASVDAASSFGVQVLAGVPLRMMGFDDLEEQRPLVRMLTARRPDAYVLMLDGLAEDRAWGRILNALRLALLLQTSGAPVLMSRPGDLRRLFWAFGIRGTEFGLGRLLRFSVPDYTKKKGGPGPLPGPRFELPSLAASLPVPAANEALQRPGLLEVDCECPVCQEEPTVGRRLARTSEHDAHVVQAEALALAGLSPTERVARYDDELERAIRRWRRLNMAGADLGQPRRLESQRQVIDEAVKSGLLDPARIATELRLFES